jgi:hypothetical protein
MENRGMGASSDKVTDEGQRLIDTWEKTQDRLRSTQRDVERLEREVEEARAALARWMLPADAEVGEKIGVWHGDILYVVSIIRPGEIGISKRTTRASQVKKS